MSDEHLLRKGGVRRARQMFVLTAQDPVNMKVAEQIRRLASAPGPARPDSQRGVEPLRVLVHLADAQLASLLAARELGRTDAADVRLDFPREKFAVDRTGLQADSRMMFGEQNSIRYSEVRTRGR